MNASGSTDTAFTKYPMGKFADWFFGIEEKSAAPQLVQRRDEQFIDDRIANNDAGGYISVVYACAQVISQGLALPPIYVQKIGSKGREYATTHSIYPLLTTKPNLLQTSYELREVMGWQAALDGNAYAWLNRSKSGEILEIIPLDKGEISRVDPATVGGVPSFTLAGRPVKTTDIWHFRGPSAHRKQGLHTSAEAQRAIALAAAAESFGTDLFKNRAALEGIISFDGVVDQAQIDRVRESFKARQTGEGKRGRTAFFPASVKYQPVSSSATDAQWVETRQMQITEICRYFRVSPTKVFHTLGSQSYASVEQAHIAHDQDTDAHWHARYAQSATNALLTDAERRAGYAVVIDNRDYLRGTATERANYYNAGLTGGWLTQNEAREAEGYPRSDDPLADKLRPAANLFGDQSQKTAE